MWTAQQCRKAARDTNTMDKAALKKLHQDLYNFQLFAGARVGDVSGITNEIMEKIEEVIRDAPEAPKGTPPPDTVLLRRNFFDNNPPGALNGLSKLVMAMVAPVMPSDVDVVVLLYARGAVDREISCTTTMSQANTHNMLKEFLKKEENKPI